MITAAGLLCLAYRSRAESSQTVIHVTDLRFRVPDNLLGAPYGRSMEATAWQERRAEKRIPIRWQVRDIQPSGHRIACHAVNITLGGVLLEYRSGYTVPPVLDLELDVGEARRVYCQGRLVREERTLHGTRLCAVEFTQFFGEGRSILRAALAQLSP